MGSLYFQLDILNRQAAAAADGSKRLTARMDAMIRVDKAFYKL